MIVLVLGSYYLNVEEMTLSRDELEVVLEPKVLEVLLYLYSNPNRFISMEELHENVWQGRCVSDAAVRRTISKLRLLFKDDHKVPQYIKSLPKRGYKLICQISSPLDPADNATLDTSQTPAVTALSSNHQNLNSPMIEPDATSSFAVNHTSQWRVIFDRKATRKKVALLLACTIVLLLLIAIVNDGFRENQLLTEPDLQVITALPGDKMAIAQSADKQLLAFSGQVNQQTGYQIYLKTTDEPNFVSLTRHAFLPAALAFSADNKQLFYSDLALGNSSLNSISLTGAMKGQVDTLVASYYHIGDVFTSSDPGYVYFSGQKLADHPQYIYRYDLKNHNVNRMTSCTQKTCIDIKGAISPDGTLMAVLRYSKYEKSSDIRVIDLTSHEVVFKNHQEQIIYDLQWLNNKQLIVLERNRLYTLDCNKRANVTVLEHSPQLADFIVDSQHIIGLSTSKHNENVLFVEQALPFAHWSTNHIYAPLAGSYFLGYQPENDSKLVLSYKNQVTSLGRLNTKTNQISPYIQTKYSLIALASSSGELELIRLNHRFALLNTETQAIKYITAGDDFIGDAAFSADEQYILFSIKNYDKWKIFRYHIDSQTIDELFSGYRYIRPYGDNYILATDNGDLFWYNSANSKLVALNHQLSEEPNTHWDVTSGRIYWSSHDLVQTAFHQLDISDITHPLESIKTFDYNQVRPYFSINHDGSSLIYRQKDVSHSQLIRFSVNE